MIKLTNWFTILSMKNKNTTPVTLDQLATRSNTMRNYIVSWAYEFAPKAISQLDVHIGLGSLNHAETLTSLMLKSCGSNYKIIAIVELTKPMKNIGYGTPQSKLDLG